MKKKKTVARVAHTRSQNQGRDVEENVHIRGCTYWHPTSSLASGTGSSSTSPYSLSNRAYSDPTSAYNLYSQYYGAAYPYGMGGFGSSTSGTAGAGFSTKGEYGSSYYGSYASWTGNPYR